jgi:acyl-coenzyme A thioesterase PaaI-like protein
LIQRDSVVRIVEHCIQVADGHALNARARVMHVQRTQAISDVRISVGCSLVVADILGPGRVS